MTRNRFTSGAILCCLLLCAQPSKTLEAPRSSSHRRNFWEFALEKINPANTDYGAELERERQMFIRQLADLRMWAGASGLVIMLSACIVIVRQRGEKRRREIVTAELVAQYHNALVDARMRLERAIADNSALREAAQTTAIACNALDASPNSLPASPGMYLETNFPARARRTAAIPESPQINTRIAELERQLRESREREKRLERELERVPPQPRPKPPQKLAERSPRGTTPL